ncbi:hypothetical protein CBD41_03120 [bacterium TMED181]|nr:hypothetical protein [Planctomycetota bacterium]OUW46024.1 MAG: hypothetical protein CBD41_03120 [bacterium TMED181]
MLRIHFGLIMAALIMLCSTAVEAQTYKLSAPNTSNLPGGSLAADILMTNLPESAQGFQFGINYDPTILTLDSVVQGSTLQSLNSGDGAEFFHMGEPTGSGGITVGAIVSLAPPLLSIPAGSDQSIARLNFLVQSTATPAQISPLTFTNSLGSPPVLCVISVNGASQSPILEHGSVTVETPAPTGLQVVLDDACVCTGTASWTNGGTYDSIIVSIDGIASSYAGDTQSISLNLNDGVATNVDVYGISNGQDSVATSTSYTCNSTPPNAPISDLSCSVDHDSCTATLSWVNNSPNYQALELKVDGQLIATLGGTETTTTYVLPAEMTLFTLEISGLGECGEALAGMSCEAECLPERFRRGDVNSDTLVDISDAIGTLSYLFQGTPMVCLDAIDTNDDGGIDISDAISTLSYIFAGGTPPAAPGPSTCGVDPASATPDPLDCANYDTASCN